jgi:hypothetical protein
MQFALKRPAAMTSISPRSCSAGHGLYRRGQIARRGSGAVEQLVDRLGQGGGAAIAERNHQPGTEVTAGQRRLDPGDVAICGVERPDEEC